MSLETMTETCHYDGKLMTETNQSGKQARQVFTSVTPLR